MSGPSVIGLPNLDRPSPLEAGLEGFVPAAERTRAAARQLIRLRWLAICGVLGVVVTSHKLLHAIEFPIPLYLIAAAMAAVNVVFELTSRRLHAKPVAAAEHHAYVQIGWDIVSLLLLTHFSGGVENPFLLYLVFHVVLASMVMGERQTYIVAGAACAAVMGIFLLEGYGLVGHYHLLLLPPGADIISSYHAGICAALMSTFMVTAYLSNSIMRKVRQTETLLLAQNQFLREAEERIRVAGAELSRATDNISELISAAARDQSFDTRYSNPRLEPCWKVLGCTDSLCPCHGQPPMRCWQMTETRCDRQASTFPEKVIRCRSCAVFRRACPDRLTELAEGFNSMMVILGRKAEELKQVRYHALQQERMAAIGQMAAGIAHEVSNPLASLYSLVQVLSASSAEDKEAMARLVLMQQSIERISKIVRQIVDFGRPLSSEEWRYSDVGKIILDTLHLLSYDRRAQGVEMMADFDPRLPRTMIIEHQLQQVFMNIALNALDAMNGRGKLSVRAGRNNGSIEVVFTDTGEGMTTEEIQHIFEPYYTTKAARAGTGLGLALSYNIIRKHGGTILVQSEKGKGSSFALSIPLRGPKGENGATSPDSGR
jgi:signal transduction histidine kinase